MMPIIGISAGKILSNEQVSRISLIDKYVEAIQVAGGVPLIIPTGIKPEELTNCLQIFDGYLLTGGGDISNDLFNGEPNARISDVDKNRDLMEIEITKFASKENRALLGICRGIQVMNVALGGTLYTDIGTQHENAIKHDWYPRIARNFEAHSISILKNSKLNQIMHGDEINVNSLHHQAIKDLGEELILTAIAPDGIIEGVENPKLDYFLGVQWHPEWMLSSPSMLNLFKSFVSAAKKNDDR